MCIRDSTCHDYSVDKPKWVEIDKDHFVLGNDAEIGQYREMLKNPLAMNNTYAML